MRAAYVAAMEGLYLVCMAISGFGLVIMSLIVPWGVFTRYVLGYGSSWPEPAAILMMIVFTFLGAAAGYRANAHVAVTMFVSRLPPRLRAAAAWLVEALLALLSVFMVIWGLQLSAITWHQTIGEFPFLSVGVTYLPIPIGGAITLLFIIEQAWAGPPGERSFVHREPVSAD